MNKLVFNLAFLILICSVSSAQSITEIKLNAQQQLLTYIKDGDSLFIKSLRTDEKPKLITNNLRRNSDKIFRIWNKKGDKFVYEKNGIFYVYNVSNHTSKKIEISKKLQLFKWMLINQIDVSKDDKLYFSAGTELSNGKFLLLELDTNSSQLTQVAEEEVDIANITLSLDEKHIAYSFYDYQKGIPYAGLKVIDLKNKKVLFEKGLQENFFFTNLSFSSNKELLARNLYGNNHIFSFAAGNNAVDELQVPITEKGKFLRFVDKNTVLSIDKSDKKNIYSLYNKATNTSIELLNESNSNIINIKKTKEGYILFYTSENGKSPKALYKKEFSYKGSSKPYLVHSFIRNNPLRNVHYKIYNYQNGDGNESQAYIYLPKMYRSSSAKLPLVIMVYGGFNDTYPKLDYFMNKCLFSLLDKGYALALLNTRGFNNERRKDGYGKIQLEDTELFLSNVSKDFAISNKKVIVAGHSHGATMVNYYLTHSNKFVGGISVNGASDWIAQAKLKSMAGLPGEMGGSPDSLYAKYKTYSPIENMKSTMSPLLIVSGIKDTQIPVDINSNTFYKKGLQNKLPMEFLQFSDEGHLIINTKNQFIFEKKVFNFLEMLFIKK